MTTPTQTRTCPRCGALLRTDDQGGYDHDLVPGPDSPCYTPQLNPTLDPARLREFALTVEQVLRADNLGDLGKLARIAVAHARLTGRRGEAA